LIAANKRNNQLIHYYKFCNKIINVACQPSHPPLLSHTAVAFASYSLWHALIAALVSARFSDSVGCETRVLQVSYQLSASKYPLLSRHIIAAGPVNIHERVLRAMNVPGQNHRDPWFAPFFKDVLHDSKYVFQTEHGTPFIFTGTGTGG
jgi:hypothetical protein